MKLYAQVFHGYCLVFVSPSNQVWYSSRISAVGCFCRNSRSRSLPRTSVFAISLPLPLALDVVTVRMSRSRSRSHRNL